MWTFADRLRKIRVDVAHMHQREFAAYLGVKESAYAAWESGRNKPDEVAVAKRIQLLTGVPAVWTLGLDEGPTGGGLPRLDSDQQPSDDWAVFRAA